jgi:hypothetical protein
MAIYKIFPTADASIYSFYPSKNTGLDELLEVSVLNNNQSSDNIRRSLILFSDSDIQKIKNLKSGSWDAYLKLYLSNAENLSTAYKIEINQISDFWTMGTGKFIANPEIKNGVSWYNTSSYISASNNWSSPSYYRTPGGGSWNTKCSQSFDYKDEKDINALVTPIVTNWFNGANNYGFILKHSSSIENNSGSYVKLNFYSVDSPTIYPPCLEVRWDDSSYITGSLIEVTSNRSTIHVSNNPDIVKNTTDKFQFRISARDTYPTRTFTTSSLYTTNKRLPSSSYWAIKDVKTEDTIIDFDNLYTKISCDREGNYFNIYMSGLEPERYYKILIKTVLNSGESIVIDSGDIFKITR